MTKLLNEYNECIKSNSNCDKIKIKKSNGKIIFINK